MSSLASWLSVLSTGTCTQGPPSQLPMRNVQSSHVLHQAGSQAQPQAEPSFRPGSWDGSVPPPLPALYPSEVERGSAEVRLCSHTLELHWRSCSSCIRAAGCDRQTAGEVTSK